MTQEREDNMELFKILKLDTQKKRDKYLSFECSEETKKDEQRCTFIRTEHSTQIQGETQNAELESDT